MRIEKQSNIPKTVHNRIKRCVLGFGSYMYFSILFISFLFSFFKHRHMIFISTRVDGWSNELHIRKGRIISFALYRCVFCVYICYFNFYFQFVFSCTVFIWNVVLWFEWANENEILFAFTFCTEKSSDPNWILIWS